MSSSSDKVKNWRKNVKIKAVHLLGGKCQNCGYNRCYQALDFHHINPQEKDFSFGQIIGSPTAWKHIEKELKKCRLICANCHAEIHEGILRLSNGKFRKISIPKIKNKFSNYSKDKLKRYIFKSIAMNGFNKKCGICGYNRSRNSLQFHHIDKNKKDFTISIKHISNANWHKVEEELKKCIMLCSCCHREYMLD